VRVIGVQSATYPSMVRALEGVVESCADGMTIAEGIAVKTAGGLTREVVRALVDDLLLVEESAIEAAVALLLSVEKTVVGRAGATGLAALLAHREQFAGKKVATILTGGNIDLRVLASVAMRELVRTGRLMRIAVTMADAPGGLARLATAIGEEGANIIDVAHDRMSLALNAKGTVLEVVAEVESQAHGEALLANLKARGFAATSGNLYQNRAQSRQGEARGANLESVRGHRLARADASPPAPFRSGGELLGLGIRHDPDRPTGSGDARDATARGVGGGREAHPARHPALDLGASVRALQMIARDLIDRLGLLARVGLGDDIARDLGEQRGRDFAVADQLEQAGIGLPPVCHVDVEIAADRIDGGAAEHLRGCQRQLRHARRAEAGKRAGSQTIAELAAGHGDAFVETLAASQLERDTIAMIERDDVAQFRPKERAVGEETAAHDGVAAIAALADDPALGALGIVAQVDGAGPRRAQILMGDQCEIPAADLVAEVARDRPE